MGSDDPESVAEGDPVKQKILQTITANEHYLIWFKDAWPYLVGAVLLSLVQIVTFAVTGNGWGITGAVANWGAWLYEALGGSVREWAPFASDRARAVLDEGPLNHGGSIRNVGTIAGAFFAVLIASSFKFKKIRYGKQVFAAVLGGLLMGYGARVGMGCNIGAFFSGVAVLSLSGWVFGVFLFLGALVGSRILMKFFV